MQTPTHHIRNQSPSQSIFPWMTVLIIASVIFVFVWQLLSAGLMADDVVGNELAFSRGQWYGKGWWTVITYAWVHSLTFGGTFWMHVTFNMIGLLCFGPALEGAIGSFSFLLLYVGGAVFSGLAWMYLTQGGMVDTRLVGASGAVFAVIGGLGFAKPGARVVILVMGFIPIWQNAGRVALVLVVLEFFALPSRSDVAHIGHLAGAVFGVVFVILHNIFGPTKLEV